ncbi:MAG: ISAs1 family transposase, partial [Alphaproteobacteria bacterium]|nr:ISAs1 family transposase [Alphaproteobacteria bacterium]
DTFSTVFRALDPEALAAALQKFANGFGVKGVVSLDGKALRGAFNRGKRAMPLHMVNVWAAETRMALAQRKAPNRNEAKGALQLLSLLNLEGAIVTADALHCRPDTAAAIRARKGHYVLALKQNRTKLFKAAGSLVDAARKPSRTLQRSTRAHGRSERRRAVVVPAAELGQDYGFPDLVAIGRVDSWRRTSTSPAKQKVRFFLLSRKLSANQLLKIVRSHWSIENNLHWVLDVLFAEDACRSRKDHAPENLAALRKIALNALQATPGPQRVGQRISHKMLHARWNDAFLLEALAHLR